ncbi:uncharacterized protein MONOS_5074 [Monocercomonoides exilis]|uniref:uncharacterized protein n=1 Tax=Monocercomonoides exilis TaxID=2049356 RepID=UPI0035595F93|nr:hypothetical protein MONOS_5074 [Monocercomonoides exilis]|eukprot:MONOS_5074.1-p1 / transcript=MONOS_5074.1 / gene=MONOS_5074 / organism=Monocercomonoides_exilis_PA203 / gene_product=unspecified product / transcript_product=unspecified product / location=Mono_scaffold00144:17064-17542(-) / protein_length=94 / sequence_SO=supercontig / SO=protein_coding / is_pseudo=false
MYRFSILDEIDTFHKREGMHGTRLFEHLDWIEMEFQFKGKRIKCEMSEIGLQGINGIYYWKMEVIREMPDDFSFLGEILLEKGRRENEEAEAG